MFVYCSTALHIVCHGSRRKKLQYGIIQYKLSSKETSKFSGFFCSLCWQEKKSKKEEVTFFSKVTHVGRSVENVKEVEILHTPKYGVVSVVTGRTRRVVEQHLKGSHHHTAL